MIDILDLGRLPPCRGFGGVRPIGWMAIFGDGLGNFIDGLSIGAAMNQGIAAGITTAIATWSSNIPQELGDFALLVRAGMSPFQALFYNYMSGNLAFIGAIIGIVFGSDMESARWIFSISGGTSLYLALAVMVIYCYFNIRIMKHLIFIII